MYLKESEEVNRQAVCGIEPERVDPKAIKPLFGTQEWAPYTENCLTGCSHDCRYCYAKASAAHYHRVAPGNWQNEILRKDILCKPFSKRDELTMFPSTHDITPIHLHDCMTFMEHILIPGNDLLIVTKPHLECIKAICERFLDYKTKITFRFTITSSDSNTLKFWEPNAPDFAERLECLKFAFSEGYQTSVSCEPMLDGNVADVINQVSPFITDTIWLGKANYLLSRLTLNGETAPATRAIARQLMQIQSNGFIWNLYFQYINNPQIRWKDSIKGVVGLDIFLKLALKNEQLFVF